METQQQNPVLRQAWKLFATYDANAGTHQTLFKRLQVGILALGVLAVLLALVQTQIFGVDPDATTQDQLGFKALRYAIILAPILISIFISATNRFKAGNKWIRLRAAAESLKREIYRYRGRSGIYSDEATTEKSRRVKLAEKMKLVNGNLMSTAVNETAVTPYGDDQPLPPPMYGAEADDDGFSDLTAETYIKIRLGDQLKYFGGKTGKLEKKMKLLQWSIYLIGGLGTLLAAVGFELWVAMTTALAAAVVTYLEYNQTENTLIICNQVVTNLNNTLTWWSALTTEERAGPTNRSLLIEQTEQVLADEQGGWIQQMTDALSELQQQHQATVERVEAEVADVRTKGAELEAAKAAEADAAESEASDPEG